MTGGVSGEAAPKERARELCFADVNEEILGACDGRIDKPKDFTFSELRAKLEKLGEKRFRADQLFGWLYKPNITSPTQMVNLPQSLRDMLPQELMTLEHVKTLRSRRDGTQKFLFRTADAQNIVPDANVDVSGSNADVPGSNADDADARHAHIIETVFMQYHYGNTVCISSQAGCRMACGFCASGVQGLARNLSPAELSDQILLARALTGEDIRHVVVMGTGEPMDNLESLMKFIDIVTDAKGLGLSRRNITVSSSGLLPELEKFWKAYPQVGLAISLHAPDDALRNSFMPIGKSYGVDAILAAAARYTNETGRRISFEYALMEGVNDSEAHAAALCTKLKGLNCHVNLIPLNAVREVGLRGTARAQVQRFADVLESRKIQHSIRRELGADIAAACGQLRLGQEGA